MDLNTGDTIEFVNGSPLNGTVQGIVRKVKTTFVRADLTEMAVAYNAKKVKGGWEYPEVSCRLISGPNTGWTAYKPVSMVTVVKKTRKVVQPHEV
jgi:hypothetical protein